MNSAHQQALLSDLIVLAHADEKVTETEYNFLLRLAERMGISKKEADALFEHPLPSKPIFSELERIIHFHKMILLMNVDGEVHPKEVKSIRDFGLKMGIRPGAIERILQQMHDYENMVIPSSELVKIFQTYYN